jgi:hypothetical protein
MGRPRTSRRYLVNRHRLALPGFQTDTAQNGGKLYDDLQRPASAKASTRSWRASLTDGGET